MQKQIILSVFFSTLFLFCFSQKNLPQWSEHYSGLAYYKDSIVIDDTEVTIGAWLEYATLNENEYLDTNKIPKGDSLLQSILINNQPVNGYGPILGLNERQFEQIWNSPISNITFEEVIDFCKWRTEQDSLTALELGLPVYFKFELPSTQFLKELCHLNDSLYLKTKDSSTHLLFNHKNAEIIYSQKKLKKAHIRDIANRIGTNKLPQASFFANDYGLFDLVGNVSEMSSTKGIACGGNFTLYASDCMYGQIQHYQKNEYWLGFRCIGKPVYFTYSSKKKVKKKIIIPLQQMENIQIR